MSDSSQFPGDDTIPTPRHDTPTIPSDNVPPRIEARIASRLEPGQHFGPYVIHRMLGKGGMGEVYEAEHTGSGRRLAIKVLGEAMLDRPEEKRRFLREGRLAAAISHPNCVYVYGTEEIDGALVISMELAPGGTLKDVVKEKGPMPISGAVEAALQLCAGLEAAAAVGVLHRDIKPANCFVQSEGFVKVGDFGLSVSTIARDQTHLTQSGSFLGTPVFSSPEQLRGETLDVRSDIYALGVTLFYLLTGKLPFDSGTMMNVMAMVLDKQPESPRRLRPDVPEGLAKVVLRCLEKKPEARYANYAELRSALQPFDAEILMPARPGPRFLGACIDTLILSVLIEPVEWLMRAAWNRLGGLGEWHAQAETTMDTKYLVVFTVVGLFYFLLSEAKWGTTIGKYLVGIRVLTLEKQLPSFNQAFVRACIYIIGSAIASSPLTSLQPVEISSSRWLLWGALTTLLCLLYVSTMRRRNGYATLSDLASQTRVVKRPAAKSHRTRAPNAVSLVNPISGEGTVKLGPYVAFAKELATEPERVTVAYDPVLRRNVWLHLLPTGTPPLSPARRDAGRVGCLRWLMGHRGQEICWDAYEAPDGGSLLRRIEDKPDWGEIRHWLAGLADELASGLDEGSAPAMVSLERVWITSSGDSKVLNFRAPQTDMSKPERCVRALSTYDHLQEFLLECAFSALHWGADGKSMLKKRCVDEQMPLHACDLLRQLSERHLQTRADLLSAMDFPPTGERRLSASRKTKRLVVGFIPALALASIAIVPLWASNFYFMQRHPELVIFWDLLMRLSNDDYDTPEEREEIEIYLVGQSRDIPLDSMGRKYLKTFWPELSKLSDSILVSRPTVTDEQFAAATAAIEPEKKTKELLEEIKFIFFYSVLLCLFSIPIFSFPPLALVFRGGPTYEWMGMTIMSARTARPASRLRCFLRSALVWWVWVSAFIIGISESLRILDAYRVGDLLTPANIPVLVCFVFLATCLAWEIFGKRSLHDLIANTYVVAK